MPLSSMVGTLENTRRAPTRVAPRHVPGETGVWIVLFGDLFVFTVLFVLYLYRRGQDESLFAISQEHLNRDYGAMNTLVLLSSSLLVVFAARAFRTERLRPMASRLTVAGAVVGACFVVIKAFEYHEKVNAGITASTNDFFLYYYVLTGLHLMHVVIGLIILTVLSRLARKPTPSPTDIGFFEGGACFWHVVDLLWIVIFPLLFLVR